MARLCLAQCNLLAKRSILFHAASVHNFFSTLNYVKKYSEEESNKILAAVNQENVDDLNKFNISHARLQKLKQWKKRNGNFNTVDQMLELDSFGVKVLENFCNSIINNEAESVIVRSALNFTIPKLLDEDLLNLRSCTSVHIGISTISWSKFELNPGDRSTIVDWNYYDLNDGKIHLFEAIQNVMQINKLIPQSDMYVLESPPMVQSVKPGSPAVMNISLHKAQFFSMISLILANRENQHDDVDNIINRNTNLVFLRPYLSSRLFRTYIGSEKVSTESTVSNLLRLGDGIAEVDSKLSPANYVKVPSHLTERYRSARNIQKEFLGQSLLMGLTFVRLSVNKCSESIRDLNKRN